MWCVRDKRKESTERGLDWASRPVFCYWVCHILHTGTWTRFIQSFRFCFSTGKKGARMLVCLSPMAVVRIKCDNDNVGKGALKLSGTTHSYVISI
jgi:hypothetical protein